MTPYAVSSGLVPEEDRLLLQAVRQAVHALPDGLRDRDGESIVVSCHMLARAVSRAFGMKWKDGYYVLPSHKHSWTVTPNGNVIDVYPVAMIGGPILFDSRHSFLEGRLYLEVSAAYPTDIRFHDPLFIHHTAVVHDALRKAMEDERRHTL